MASAPIILVPGFWLGAWAWDEVASRLRAAGHAVTPVTLPGQESVDADRSAVTLDDHVEAVCQAVQAAGEPVVLVVHSASGFSGYAASDRIPERIAEMVYVDTAPGIPPMDADFADVEKPLDWAEIESGESLEGLSEEQLATFRERAVPVPGGVIRGSYAFRHDERRDIPSTLVCTSYTGEQYRQYAGEHPEWPFLAGLPELRNVAYVDLPTSHWPMWSKPDELAEIISGAANRAGGRAGGATS